MGVRELKEKYGINANTPQTFNRAIRAEIPGGDALLDALNLVGRTPKRGDNEQIFACLCRVRAVMTDEIADRYELFSSQAKKEATL